MPRWLRLITWSVAALTAVALVAALAVVWTVRRSFPQTDGTLTVPGLSAPVTVVRNAAGIPDIYAQTARDLFFAQGYVEAQDRFFQMDFRRHLTSGRLTELFGRGALETDMFVRTLGWQRVAEAELPLLSRQTRHYLRSFSDGVNAYLADHSGSQLSLEYAVLGVTGLDYTPQPWTPAESLAWIEAMAWNLGTNLEDEVARALESVRLTPHQIRELYPPYPYRENAPILTSGRVQNAVVNATGAGGRPRPRSQPSYRVKAVRPVLRSAVGAGRGLSAALGLGDALGSNAWAVSGRHTADGAPMLANDPHLDASMPGVWYQMGLHCTTISPKCPFNVSGFTFAGLPGIVIGHNDSIAWGFTNLEADVQDLYLEKVTNGNRYLYDGQYRKLRTRTERFFIAGQDDPVTITVRECRDGPLISDVSAQYSTVGADAPVRKPAPPRGHGYAVALRWTALAPTRTADALFAIDRADRWRQFRAAARHLDVPTQNLVYADRAGNIGYQAAGRIPVRRNGNGRWPVPGWDGRYQWRGYIPFRALPHVLNPPNGYIVSANQPVTSRSYPYLLGTSFDYGYRASRIRTLLTRTAHLTVTDMAKIQMDTYSQLAKRLTPLLLAARLKTPYYQTAQRLLAGWNYRQGADSAAAAYFNVVWTNLLALTFDDDLPQPAWPQGGSRWWAVMLTLIKHPTNSFWDNQNTPHVVETRDDIIRQAMVAARDDLTELMSRDPHDWQWGRLHTLTLQNESLGAAGSPVAFLFNRGGYPLSGSPSVVDANGWDAAEGYGATSVPSMRMIVPLGALDAARWISLTGESGHAYDSHYTDQTQLWLRGRTLPWPFSSAAVRRSGQDVLTLSPRG